jgi:hypothetical protein
MHLHLPYSAGLPIGTLAGCFENTTATYKFYWFLSILQAVEHGQTTIPKRVLFARMLAHAWYTVNYFHVSFGNFDLMSRTIKALQQSEGIPINAKQEDIVAQLCRSQKPETINALNHFDANVPHRFLSKWFPQASEKDVYAQSQLWTASCLYALDKKEIRLHPAWLDYLQKNAAFLKSFCYWHLALFLQQRNPNVPDIPNKLIKPAVRGDLKKFKTAYWDIVLTEIPDLRCIYSDKPLHIGHYVVEHFIPHAFMPQDLIWNLIPADKQVNNQKSNKLPPLDRYFDAFYALQKIGFDTIKRLSTTHRLLDDYAFMFPNDVWEKTRFRNTLQPLVSIAANNGFQMMEIEKY